MIKPEIWTAMRREPISQTDMSLPSTRKSIAFKWGAFLISVAVGLIVDLALVVVIGMALPPILASAVSPESSTNLVSLVRILCGAPPMIVIGLLYCFLHSRGGSLDLVSGLLGGAACGALTGLVSRLAEACLLLAAMSFQAASGLALLPPDVSPLAAGAMLSIGTVLNTCAGTGAGAVLGLIGGGLGGLLFSRRRT